MPIGPAIRRSVGPKLERQLSAIYRRVFVDLGAVANVLAEYCPRDARLLDVGGGDGELLNKLLVLRPDLTLDMVDIATTIGKFIEPSLEQRIRRFPATPVEALPDLPGGYGAALISDVMHHLSPDYRRDFLSAVRAKLTPSAPLFVKDIEPGHPIASLSLFCDRHISGDKSVSLVSMAELTELGSHLSACSCEEIGLLAANRPNYIMRFSFR